MQEDDDTMIPRDLYDARANARRAEADNTPDAKNLTIDPIMLAKRAARKSALPARPVTLNEEISRYIDRRLAQALPAFNNPVWRLGDTVRWITERTPEAVDGITIDEIKLGQALSDIREALTIGVVRASGRTQNDPVPRPLPAETWDVHDLVVEKENGLLRVFPLRLGASTQEIFSVRLDRSSVFERWPPAGKSAERETSTIAAENRCRAWLVELMRSDADTSQPKGKLRTEAKSRFRVGKRGFERAWEQAIRETGAHHFSRPGRRS